MSEPTIKPVGYRCPRCGGTPNEWHFEHASDVVMQPLYTHDDLVAAAREVLRRVAPDVVVTETCSAIVERLTGVKR